MIYSSVFLLLSSAFIAGKFLEAGHSSLFSDILNITGGFWMGFMLYSFLFLLASDIIFFTTRLSGILAVDQIHACRKWAVLISSSAAVMLIAGGFVNSLIPVVRSYEITIDKPAGGLKSLRVAAVSDIHLGSVIRARSMRKLSSALEKMKPDIVFLLGDVVDGEIGPVLRGDLLKHFTKPHAREGTFAITGNHEFIGGAKRTIPYIESKGIKVLQDESIVIMGAIQVIGRIDRDSFRFNSKRRKSIEELTGDIDHSLPVILLDHQPLKLEESEKYGVDLQLSGHTHDGQMWPINYLTRAIYEVSHGISRKGNTWIIVSSGYGSWGPRIRSGSRSEIVLVDIHVLEE
jgi:hypothetical protein